MRPSVIIFSSALLLAACAGGGSAPTPTVPQPSNPNSGGGAATSAVATSYVVVDLGTNVQPMAINGHNEVVGNYSAAAGAPEQAFLYAGGAMHNLGMLPGSSGSIANDINDSGTIIGTSFGANLSKTATLFSATSAPQSLGTGDGVSSQGVAVNATGQLVGTILPSNDSPSPGSCWGPIAIFNGQGGAQQFESYAQAVAVNSSGTILFNQYAGASCHEATVTSALYPSNTTVPYPANQRVDYLSSLATDLNDNGDVVGFYEDGTNRETAGFYYHNGTSSELLPPNYTELIPWAINNTGVIVGEFTPASGPKHAFIWANGAFTDLNTRLAAGCEQWTLQYMRDINVQGYMVGEGILAGQLHGVLLVPQF